MRPKNYAVVVGLILLAMSSLSAETIRVTAKRANIRLHPDANSTVLVTVDAGTVLEADEKSGPWYRVLLPPDSNGFRRSGYILESLVEGVPEAPRATKLPETPNAPQGAQPTERAAQPQTQSTPSQEGPTVSKLGGAPTTKATGPPPLSDAEVEQAILQGQSLGIKKVGVQLRIQPKGIRALRWLVEPVWAPGSLTKGCVTLFGVRDWVQRAAAEAKTKYRPFSKSDLTPDDLRPVLRVFTDLDVSVVIRDTLKTVAAHPIERHPFSGVIPFSTGLATAGLEAVFTLEDVRRLLSSSKNGNEFLVTSAAVGEPTYTAFGQPSEAEHGDILEFNVIVKGDKLERLGIR